MTTGFSYAYVMKPMFKRFFQTLLLVVTLITITNFTPRSVSVNALEQTETECTCTNVTPDQEKNTSTEATDNQSQEAADGSAQEQD